MEWRTGSCFILPATNKFIARNYMWRNRVRSHGRYERLEPCAAKVACTVLRGGDGGNTIPLTRPFRRGCQFGTLLVNLESHRVVDLLPNREVETSAAWVRQQLDLMVISRDRGGVYASAAAQGAPQATQSADRFHLIKNLGEAVEDLLARHLSAARKHQVEVVLQEQAPAWLSERTARHSQTSEDLPSAYQQDRLARYQQMIQLHEQGMTQGAIAKPDWCQPEHGPTVAR